MAILRLFGPARTVCNLKEVHIEASNVLEVLNKAESMFGKQFKDLLGVSAIWLNGEQTDPDASVGDLDEVAVLPPVSGG
ncbi:MAG: hypothetical protein HKL80_03805 [Acidimicrobiales bacterium]|nr:hypothetical protein [Acidimicrobiales bacterium]